MTIDWLNFTPLQSLVGGMLIGVAAAVFVLLNGRIAGISGIVGGLLRPSTGDISWRIAFLGGMLVSPILYALVAGMPAIEIDAKTSSLFVAGVLVGVGTRYGGGCTSGHGVCGISRMSTRSFAATAVFMSAGFVTVYVLRHLIYA